MDNTVGSIVLASAGRDQEGLFFVVGESDGFLLLADGKSRKLERPKRKNPRHLHPMFFREFDHPVIQKLQEGTPVTNRELRKALAAFKEGITLG
ncbi:MAG: KOW domain-containing RNA-binding protein [Clostridium sp.]|nr:KOW domain-containing RNA-binding protein [Clostridium sp.]